MHVCARARAGEPGGACVCKGRGGRPGARVWRGWPSRELGGARQQGRRRGGMLPWGFVAVGLSRRSCTSLCDASAPTHVCTTPLLWLVMAAVAQQGGAPGAAHHRGGGQEPVAGMRRCGPATRTLPPGTSSLALLVLSCCNCTRVHSMLPLLHSRLPPPHQRQQRGSAGAAHCVPHSSQLYYKFLHRTALV